jgi:methionyl-tRNA formyltransferase
LCKNQKRNKKKQNDKQKQKQNKAKKTRTNKTKQTKEIEKKRYVLHASDKAYQLLADGRGFSPGTPAFSTTKTGRHDITEILLKMALTHNKSINLFCV